ncbi:DNA integrity scanning protein DisA nucleotide-binding domain protein [Thiohalophilus sp.]|uniref:DNA integrity scanning protein DisA nucleotide-binding domain protein n=1 Tax=Thiohalophilus sp. TaxID=3028392 RepID=UPI002ACEF14F|nr:DNA integrity scanning protein DisA nucleotide-binding domain protein [Thiohalophilus sp.]MDZ7660915.1 DNA integrity scanning protein DisA nucleotide-binding domain protein [Thiohalophilus sp.]
MLLNKELSISLLKAWTADQNHPYKGRDKRTIPSQEEFEIYLDTMFQATLLREEGDSVASSVAWISKEEFIRNEIPKYRQSELCLYFENPLQFTAKNIAKMSGISNGKTSVILAHGKKPNSQIWGICYFESGLETMGSIPAGIDCSRHFAPDCPTITTLGVGSLEVSRGNGRIGRVENGEFLESHPDIVAYDMAGKYLLRLIDIEIEEGSKIYKNSQEAAVAYTYLSCIKYLVEILSQRKQGATIIVVPDCENIKDFYETSWGVTGTLEIELLQENKARLMNEKDLSGALFNLKVSKSLTNRLRNIADLAKMDGAVLLSSDLNVIAFGSKLKAKKWEGKIVEGPNDFSNSSRPVDFERLGTRHNSALNFVGSVEGAIAFVSSSDGPIRVISKDIDKQMVLYWPDCRESMFK